MSSSGLETSTLGDQLREAKGRGVLFAAAGAKPLLRCKSGTTRKAVLNDLGSERIT